MDPFAFVEKWSKSQRTERSAAGEHFLDLCELVEHPKPGDVDGKGLTFTLEKRVTKTGGGRGFADVFKAGVFAWEYKKRGADLDEALNQLLQYAGDLGNPPLLIVSDMDRIEVYTRFTGYPTTVHKVDLKTLARPRSVDLLRRAFHDPESLRPEKTIEKITEEAARQLAEIAPGIRARHDDPTRVAHFLDRLIFCLFAEDVGLLPNQIFSKLVAKYATRPADAISKDIGQLFAAMAGGGDFFGETIPHFNGNLFNDASVLALDVLELEEVHKAAVMDWSEMDPSIFGTLFERVMDPDQRSQLGAHYTGYQDIATLVEPVVMAPLRREWDACREAVESLSPAPLAESEAEAPLVPSVDPKARADARARLDAFLARLRSVRVLDPACGSGNFLYVTLTKLKDLERDVLVFSRRHDLGSFPLKVGPHQLHGIETNPYAFDLAQMTVWIGMIQWHRANGFPFDQSPVLQALDTFEHKDAILDLTNPELPAEPAWPDAEFIVGNPPFLGNKRMRKELGGDYCAALWKLYSDRIPPMTDLCGYWFEKARASIEAGRTKYAGLLATTGLKQVGSRRVLERIESTCPIFFAISDRDWILDGASIRICMVGFGTNNGSGPADLDGQPVEKIKAELKSGSVLSNQRRLAENMSRCFMGSTKVGAFDIGFDLACKFLVAPNPHGRPNSDVLRPFWNGSDLAGVNSNRWIIDFGVSMPESEAAAYIGPFEHLVKHVKPDRMNNGRLAYREKWWIHGEARPGFRRNVSGLPRYLATARVAKYRLFVWLDATILPDSKIVAIADDKDSSLGILQSQAHRVWTLANCGWHGGERGTYNPTTCFETFPFPKPTPDQHASISKAAKELDTLRSNWLKPREWVREEIMEFPGSVDGPWSRYVEGADERGIGTVRYPRLVPKDAFAFDLKKRTLTNLYNEPPALLDHAHRALDAAVFAAYGWSPSMTDDELLAALLDLNLSRPPAKGGKATADPEPGDDE